MPIFFVFEPWGMGASNFFQRPNQENFPRRDFISFGVPSRFAWYNHTASQLVVEMNRA